MDYSQPVAMAKQGFKTRMVQSFGTAVKNATNEVVESEKTFYQLNYERAEACSVGLEPTPFD